ncbi:MAG: hypothetical protein O2820_01490 [Planctomycetota bacterium]|nr:hypothetical protein [Planctomycetota bacterium]MDA1247871.1 hypothetical protein [Planctomycetota bacterium]
MRSSVVLAAIIALLASCVPQLVANDKAKTVETEAKPADPGPGWGSLPFQFIYDGEAPEPEVITPVRGAELCGKFKIIDEGLLVDKKTRGLANVVVTLNHKRKELPEALPEIVQNLAKIKVQMTNKACRFEPHVGTVWTEQTLELGNKDPDVHNMLFNLLYNIPFNEVIPPNSTATKTLKLAEKLPRPVSCSIHPFMQGWIVVKDHPYAAVSGNTGEATIAHLPVGEWEFQLWHEKVGYLSDITLNGKPATGTKGVYTWKIGSGTNERLKIELNPKLFQPEK